MNGFPVHADYYVLFPKSLFPAGVPHERGAADFADAQARPLLHRVPEWRGHRPGGGRMLRDRPESGHRGGLLRDSGGDDSMKQP